MILSTAGWPARYPRLIEGERVYPRPAGRPDPMFSSLLMACCLGALLVLQAGCSGPTAPASSPSASQAGPHALSPAKAAQLAAQLANDECERLYRKRPFTAGQQPAVLKDGQYRWGGLKEGAPGGLSALVTFRADGSEPKVEVYFSTDIRMHR